MFLRQRGRIFDKLRGSVETAYFEESLSHHSKDTQCSLSLAGSWNSISRIVPHLLVSSLSLDIRYSSFTLTNSLLQTFQSISLGSLHAVTANCDRLASEKDSSSAPTWFDMGSISTVDGVFHLHIQLKYVPFMDSIILQIMMERRLRMSIPNL